MFVSAPALARSSKGCAAAVQVKIERLSETADSDPPATDCNTKETEEMFDELCQLLEAESDEEDEKDQPIPAADSHLDPAVLPPNIEEEARQWLQKEDAEADRALQDLLPTDNLIFDWSTDHETFTGKREDFTASPGPTFTVDSDTTPLTVFRKFFDDDLLDLIVKRTNTYASELISKVTTQNSRLLRWKNTDRDEIVVFLAIIILQGLVPLHVQCDYWRENGYLTLKYFKHIMMRNRFVLLKRLLNFADPTDATELSVDQRKLLKIWPVLEDLNRKFSKLYIPRQKIAIVDYFLNENGRLSFAQRISKAAKSLRSYELCEASTGYLWSLFLYSGKGETIGPETPNGQKYNTEDMDITSGEILTCNDKQMTGNRDMADSQPTADSEQTTDSQQTIDNRWMTGDQRTTSAPSLSPPQNAATQIVQLLAKPLLGKGYTLVLDNMHNSPLLARYLKSQKTDCYGTLRIDREFVPEEMKSLAKTGISFGERVQTFTSDISITTFCDTNIVSLISTFHGSCLRYGNENCNRQKTKPQVVLDYNLAMEGVDRNQLASVPTEKTRNYSWHKRVFRRLLNVAAHNAFVIFKTCHPAMTSRVFKRRLAEEMIKVCNPEMQQTVQLTRIRCPGRSRPVLKGNHFIGTGVTKNARCVWCRQSRSKYICKQCQVSLCLDLCFEEYHTKH